MVVVVVVVVAVIMITYTINRSCFGINKVLDVKPIIPFYTRSMLIV